jgi:PncC family amidohydrolase
MVEEVVKILKRMGSTIGFVESMTGGGVSAAITKVDGSSKVFKGGLVTYSLYAKEKLLGIPIDTIKYYGVVSKEIAKEMAIAGRKVLDVDICVSITGDAGFTLQEKSLTRKAEIALSRGEVLLNYEVVFLDSESRIDAIEKTIAFIFKKLYDLLSI